MESDILKYINSKEYIPVNIDGLIEGMNILDYSKGQAEKVLSKLYESGRILKSKKGIYSPISTKGLVCGKYRSSDKGFGFILVEADESEVYVGKDNNLNAMNNDIVIAKIVKEAEEDRKAEAVIIQIIQRNTNTIIGKYEDSKSFGFVVPDDLRVGKDIFISKKDKKNAKNGDKVIVQITKWAEEEKKSEGKIIEVLGRADDTKLDYLSVLKTYGIDPEFDEKVLMEAKNMPKEIDKNELKNRKDLRDELIITIDSYDTKDIDDAINVKKISDNIYELGVHIADVSYYVKENSYINEEAINRGTSVYLINKVIPMLPKELSNGICSLNEGVDRFALSIKMIIDKQGNVVDSQIYKSVINSKKKCTYTDINEIIEKKDDAKYEEYKQLLEMIGYMKELKEILEEKRYKRGSIEFDLYEAKIELDENDKPIDITKRERGVADNIIEEFMLAANEAIAETFYHIGLPFIYRVHDIPSLEKVENLNKILVNMNIKIKGLNSKDVYPKTMQKILDEIKDKENGKMISNLVLRSMQLARYSEENAGHFGLAAKYYCHFTSPIRRYPDLFIHRVISEWIKSGYNLKEDQITKYTKQASEYAKISSEMERNSEKAEREFDNIKECEYMEDKIGEEYEGIISSFTTFGMFVELENTIEGLIRYDDMKDDFYDYDEINMCLIGRKNKKKYIIGEKVNIRVKSANKMLRRIDFEINDRKE